MKKAVLISVQILVEVDDENWSESAGIDILNGMMQDMQDWNVIDYRHPKVAGVYLRPVRVTFDDKSNDAMETIIQC